VSVTDAAVECCKRVSVLYCIFLRCRCKFKVCHQWKGFKNIFFFDTRVFEAGQTAPDICLSEMRQILTAALRTVFGEVRIALLLFHFMTFISFYVAFLYRVQQKSSPLKFFCCFSPQPFGILIWYFTHLFVETFYI